MNDTESSVKERLLTSDEPPSFLAQKMEKQAKQVVRPAPSNIASNPTKLFSAFGNSGQSDTSSLGSSTQPLGDSLQEEYQRHQVARGNLDKMLLPRHGHVRIYFSSNPQDSPLERAVLWKQVLSSLRDHCREQYDIEFQIIDLNAGPDNGMFVPIRQRLKDIKTCQETSLSTGFVALLSHKYWTPSLPLTIDGQLFEILLKVAYTSKLANCRLLEDCYERDENAIPPSYVLKCNGRSLSGITKAFNENISSSNLASSLQHLLRDSATHALNSNTITQTQADVLLTSHLEEEIRRGILKASELHHSNNCVCYVRTINSMETDMNYGRICNYVDVLPTQKDSTGLYVTEDMLDHVAKTKLNKIREKMLPEKVISSDGQARVYKCAVTWMPQVGLKSDAHSEYIEDFNGHLQHIVIKMTARGARHLRRHKPEHEMLCHSLLAKSIHQHSYELQDNELASAKEFLCHSTNKFCVVHGSNGCGKTHLMSAIAAELREWYDEASNPICVMRFIGQTFSSCYIVLLLNSINIQLEKCFGIKQETSCMWCTDIVFQKTRFASLLQNATVEQPIVIILDGVDKLFDSGDNNLLSIWLPLQVPDNVKVVVSVSSNSSTYQQLSGLIADRKANVKVGFIEMKNFSHLQCSKHLQRLLANQNRHITSGQLVFALQSLKDFSKEQVITPCLLSLVLMHAVRWHSSNDVTRNTIGKTEFEAVNNFIKILQQSYGDCFVRIAVSLITASKFGVTEQELEEILPTYNSVIDDLKMFQPQLRCVTKSNFAKFSGMIKSALAFWLHNLLSDLSPLLLCKLYAGCQLYTWTNSVVKNIMESLYLTSTEQKQSVQKILVRYYVDYIGRGKYPSNQKVPFKTAHIAIELPYHLIDLRRESEALELCFLNLHWLTAIMKTFGIVPVLSFLEQAYKTFDNSRPMLIVERSIRLAIPILQSNFGAFPGEMFSRTSPFARIFPALKNFISQCTSYTFDIQSLLPAGMHAQAPGAPLRVSFAEEAEIAEQVLVYESKKMTNVVYCTRNRLKFFDMVTGDPMKEMAFNHAIRWLRVSRDKQFIVVLSGPDTPTLCILDEKTLENKSISLEGALDLDWDSVSFEEVDLNAAVSTVYLAVWVKLHTQQILLFDIKLGKIVQKLSCENVVHTCVISNDEQFLYAVNLPQTIVIFSTASGRCLCTLGPITFAARGHVVNLFETFDDHLIGVYSSGFVQVWKKTQKETFVHLYELDSRFSDFTNQQFNVIHSSISQDKAWLALVKPSEIDVWNLKIWKTSCEIPCRQNEVFTTAYFCNEQKYLLVTLAGYDLSVYVWDITSVPATCISIIDGHSSQVIDMIVPSFKATTTLVAPWVVTVSNDDTIRVWNLENLPLIPTLTMTGRPITSVYCAGNYTVTGDMSDTVTVWRVSNADIVLHLQHSGVVIHIAVSEWSYKAVTADENNFQYVWSLRNGQNLHKMHGPEVNYLLITPNDQLVISIFQKDDELDEQAEASRVWKLEGGQVVCTFDYVIRNAQVTSNNTFLVGISTENKLIAISLWTGMLTKALGRPSASITLIHALSWKDHVISLDSQNFVTVWNIAEGASLMSLDMKSATMSNVSICDSGAILTMTDSKNNLKVLDVTNGKLRKIETMGIPLITRLSWDGKNLLYVSKKVTQDEKSATHDVKFYLAILNLAGTGTLFKYPLEGVPCSMEIAKAGNSVTVGLEEGRPVVFNIVGPDSKLIYPTEHKFKKTERMKFFPKEQCDQMWFSHEPRYDEGPVHVSNTSHHQSGQSRSSKKQNQSSQNQTSGQKLSMHLPRGNVKSDDKLPKPKVMRQLGNTTSKVKVFM